ncbi:MAG: glycosyltransferase family 4 protein [Anaerolineae bacterium]|nr:glycosyltransferase family 4 protein [Anaerolineae bacterium]
MIVRQFYPWIGGAERQAQKLSQALIAQGMDVKVITGWWFRGTSQHEVVEGIPVYRNFTMWEMFGIRGLRKFGCYLYMITLMLYLWWHRHEYDLLHMHQLNYHTFVGALAGKWFNKKTIVKIANSGSYSDLLMMQQNAKLLGTRQMLPVALQTDFFVAITPLIVQELQEVGIPTTRILEIPNGVDVEKVEPKANYQLHDPVTLVFVGRLHPQKRLDLLLPAFKQAKLARPKLRWRLLLVGDGPLRESLETMAQELDSADEIIFCGETNDVPCYLTQADIFVLPSCGEGMSNALLEAMTYGLPCLASLDGGNNDIICPGENGLLVDCNDPDILAQGITGLIDNHAQRERLGQAARQTVENRFAIKHIAEQYITLYDKLVT